MIPLRQYPPNLDARVRVGSGKLRLGKVSIFLCSSRIEESLGGVPNGHVEAGEPVNLDVNANNSVSLTFCAEKPTKVSQGL